MNEFVTIVMQRKDAGLVAKAIEYYQDFRGIKKYDVRFGVNKLRMEFEDIFRNKKQFVFFGSKFFKCIIE